MTTARVSQTATLLPSGKVLVAGGRNAAFLGQTVPIVEPDDGRAPLLNGPPVLPGGINQAAQSVDFYVFRLRDDATLSVQPIVDALGAAVLRGVTVRVLLELCPGQDCDPLIDPPTLEAQEGCQLLVSQGVQVKWGNPAFPKTHAKSLLIDDSRAFILSFNLVAATFRPGAIRRDYGVVTNDAGVIENFARLFAQDWFDGSPVTDCSLPSGRAPDATVDAYATLTVTPDNGRDQMIGTPDLPGLIRSALPGSGLKIQMEKIDPQAVRGILPAILDRIAAGVQVQVVLHPPDGAEFIRNLTVANAIIAAGGQARCQTDLHAKMILAEGPQKAFVGSQNLTQSSLDLRREVGWITGDQQTRTRFGQTFDSDWTQAFGCAP
jgi:phosphatidylserine/phosphatidylglycerophosphate/cardiolipin synthase-like enzyme